VLHLLRDIEPVLQQDDAILDQHILESRAALEKLFVFSVGAEAHDAFDSGAVVPAAIEDDNLAARGQLLDVTLRVDLGFLPVGWRGESDQTEDAWTDALQDPLDDSAFAGGVAAFKEDYNARFGLLHPFLQLDQLDLQFKEFGFVLFVLHLGLFAQSCVLLCGNLDVFSVAVFVLLLGFLTHNAPFDNPDCQKRFTTYATAR
jgi:hypothetical protein